MIVVLSTAEARWSRLLLPTLGATALVAGLGFETLAANRPRLVTALALAGALWPLADSVAYVRDISQPDTRDRALDWLAAHQRRGARVLTNMPDLGLAGAGYEALQTTGVAHDDALLARNVDVVALDPGAGEIGGLELLAAFDRTDARREAPRIEIRSAGADLRPRYRETAIAVVRVGLQSPVDVPALADHDLDTEWASEVDQDQRVEVGLSDAACIGRVELLLGTHPQRFARALALSVTTDGVSWVHVHAPASRGPVTAQIARGDASPSQVLVFDPIRARAVRLDGASRRSRRWGFAEIRVDAVGDSDMVCPRGATSP
jgi:hypothetical protein